MTDRPDAAPSVAETGTAKGDVTVVELTRAQQVIARRAAESKATVPDHTLVTDADLEDALALGDPEARIVRAAAVALREFPRANGGYRDGRFELYSRVNVGVVVHTKDSFMVPTIFDADRKTVAEIAEEMRSLADRVRDGHVTAAELGGGTFTVSNLGRHGVTSFTAIVNPPQAAALAVGAATPRPVAREGAVVVRTTATLTLTCDHRILYGPEAAGFLARVRQLLEQPGALPA